MQGDFQALRMYLRKICTDAYTRKAEAMEEFEPGLMAQAQRWAMGTVCGKRGLLCHKSTALH